MTTYIGGFFDTLTFPVGEGLWVRIATPVLRHWFAMTTFYFGVHNDMRDTNRHQKMQNALRRKAGGRMGYEIQGFPTGMSVFSRMA